MRCLMQCGVLGGMGRQAGGDEEAVDGCIRDGVPWTLVLQISESGVETLNRAELVHGHEQNELNIVSCIAMLKEQY
jgi:hypothetical protein